MVPPRSLRPFPPIALMLLASVAAFMPAAIGWPSTALATASTTASTTASAAQPAADARPVTYTVRLEQPQTQMVDMEVVIPATGQNDVELVLPAWRPGRYEILDPAGTVREMVAVRNTGEPLTVTKTEKARWRISDTRGQGCVVTYRFYANSIGNRTRHADDTHAFLSPSSCFVYVDGLRQRAIRVLVAAPADWHVATGLAPAAGEPADDPRIVVARNYDELADSPLEIGQHRILRFESAGVPHEIVVWPPDVAMDADVLVADTKAIVDESIEIFGNVPYERYVFLVHVGAGGGGTEHVNSTIMQTRVASLEGTFDRSRAYIGYLGLTAHEFFHTWNVKQFRPAGIKPYDYERENYTPLLWMAEGTTSYYDEVLPVRCGITSESRYLRDLGSLINRERDRPGRLIQSLERSSHDAWVKFNARTPDDGNCTVSFYSRGALASLALDMEVRRSTDNERSMDDVMRRLYELYPLDARGYTTDDLRAVLTELTGDDFAPFFARHIAGTETLPLESALEVVGVELFFEDADDAEADDDEDEDADGDDHAGDHDHDAEAHAADPTFRPWLGMNLGTDGGRTVVRSVRSDGPAYAAGIIADDEIVAMDGRRLPAGSLDGRLERRNPGETVTLTIFRRDRLRQIDVELAAKRDGRWVVRRMGDPTPEQEAAFDSWLGSRLDDNDKAADED
ncbi:MAG: M61 family metallopeptidase [Phycisphaerales bacterium]